MQEPEISTPDGLFESSSRYRAPVFQRLYVWGKAQLEDLIADIESADSEYGQFLGALVLKDEGRVRGPTSPANYLIIDGQQRLTTLYLILLALSQIARRYGQSDTADFIVSNYLAITKNRAFLGWPKLVPTLQDRHTLWRLLVENAPGVEWNFEADPEESKPRESSRLVAQWKRITQRFEADLIDAQNQLRHSELEMTLQSVQENLRFINITLDDHDDANSIFDRLNAKGVPLELADLVRNDVFSKFRSGESKRAEKFYRKVWHPFEKSFQKESLNHFFPVYAFVSFSGRVTKASAFPKLQLRWKNQSPESIVDEFKRYSPYFQSLWKFKRLSFASRELNDIVRRLSVMPRATVTWPFVLSVLRATEDGVQNDRDARLNLRILESFLVRRSLLGIEPTGLHAVFKGLWEKSGGEPSKVLEKIETRTIRCPNDNEVRKALTKHASDTRGILPFVLSEYERYYNQEHGFDPAPPTIQTIEHILPRNRSEDWKGEFSVREHATYAGLLGNLVPLSEMQNKSVQDQGWGEKRQRFLGSNFKSTRALGEHRSWTKSSIAERSRNLTAWIIARWPSLHEFKKLVR